MTKVDPYKLLASRMIAALPYTETKTKGGTWVRLRNGLDSWLSEDQAYALICMRVGNWVSDDKADDALQAARFALARVEEQEGLWSLDTVAERARPYVASILSESESDHAARVAELLRPHASGEEELAIALLHDVLEVEDEGEKEARLSYIRENFGFTVAEGVLKLTPQFTAADCPGISRLLRSRWEAHRLVEALKDPVLLRVKLADIIDNWHRIAQKGEAFAKIWREEKRYLLKLLGQPAADTLHLLQPDHPCH